MYPRRAENYSFLNAQCPLCRNHCAFLQLHALRAFAHGKAASLVLKRDPLHSRAAVMAATLASWSKWVTKRMSSFMVFLEPSCIVMGVVVVNKKKYIENVERKGLFGSVN
jgi:hypothetical protein